MVNFKSLTLLLILSLLVIAGCDKKETTSNTYPGNSMMTTWADTIIYEVLIHNSDTLNQWESAKTKNVHTKQIIDDCFNMIYSGNKKAYHYYTHEPMSINEIKELEARSDFSRDKIGKLQFTETWRYNGSLNQLHKQIHNILIAYEVFDEQGNLRGYKAAFYLKEF
jgi:hypothetical protein